MILITQKKRGTCSVAVPRTKAFALPSQVKQQPKSTPYVQRHTYKANANISIWLTIQIGYACVYIHTHEHSLLHCFACDQKLRSFGTQNKRHERSLCLAGISTCGRERVSASPPETVSTLSAIQ